MILMKIDKVHAETEVAPASNEFSSISLIAFAGRWITSPAAIRLTTASSKRLITDCFDIVVVVMTIA